MALKRAYGVTVSEVSAIFFAIGMLIFVLALVNISGLKRLIETVNLSIATSLGFIMILMIVSIMFFMISMFTPNYLISKNNLNGFIDRISNTEYINWIRFTRNKSVLFHTVKTGPYGQTKGMVNDKKADVINAGDYTLTSENGNKFICVYDFLSQNTNLEECVGWSLISKHYGGIVGYKAYEKAVDMDRTLLKKSKSSDSEEVINLDVN